MIVMNLDVMMAKRKMTLGELSEKMGFTLSNMSIMKQGKSRAIKLHTLNKLCYILDCDANDLLEFRKVEGEDWEKEPDYGFEG